MDWQFLGSTLLTLLGGLPLTLTLAGLTLLLSTVLGLALAIWVYSGSKIARATVGGYILVIRGTPLLVQLFLVYYGLGQLGIVRASGAWPILREPFWCAIIAFTFCQAAYSSEIFRAGLMSVSRGELEAAKAYGMRRMTILRRIVLPIGLRAVIPAYSNEMVLMVKATSLASMVTLLEVTGIAASLAAETFRIYEVFLLAGLIYLTVNGAIAFSMRRLEDHFSRHRRRQGNAGAI